MREQLPVKPASGSHDYRLYGYGSGKAKLPLPSSAIAAGAVILWLPEYRLFISNSTYGY